MIKAANGQRVNRSDQGGSVAVACKSKATKRKRDRKRKTGKDGKADSALNGNKVPANPNLNTIKRSEWTSNGMAVVNRVGLAFHPGGVPRIESGTVQNHRCFQNCHVRPDATSEIKCRVCGHGANHTQTLDGVCEDCREDAAFERASALQREGIHLGYSSPEELNACEQRQHYGFSASNKPIGGDALRLAC